MREEKRPPPKVDPRTEEILDRLERQANETAGPKRERRWTYRRPGLVANIEHPGGGFAKLSTFPVSLWCEGIQMLFSGFTYPGSQCTVVLMAKDGESIATRGVVVSCTHVERVLHATEIKFAQRIDPHVFIDSPKGDSGTQLDLPNLHGKILHIDDSEFDAKLLAHHLRGSNIELKHVKTPAEALEVLGNTMFDIILCDLNLGQGHDSLALIRDIRATGFAGPIVIMSAESHPEKIAAAKAAGAEQTIGKPYARNLLVQSMIKLHQEVGAVTTGEVLYSTLGDQLGTDELLEDYVKAASDISRQLQEAILRRDLDRVRELCLNLKGSAPGYGFATLGLAAEEALSDLDGTMSIEETKPKLRMLMLMCGNLGLRKHNQAA